MGKSKTAIQSSSTQPLVEKSSPEYFKKYPFVSVCTPTFNRRPFINALITCFNEQEYPQDRMEWIVIDDGTDPIEDIIASHPRVKYFKYDTKMTLGKKRNLMHEKSRGEILVYMDDDDYYPPKRVSHAVEMLMSHPEALCAGSSEIYIYFKHIKQMKRFGPYGPNHATAGTFAFKRKLIKQHKYNDDACLAEERAFLKDYTVPFVQLDPMKVILVFSHEHNTFDKRKLLINANPDVVRDSPKKVMDFIKDNALRRFYMSELEGLLATYEPGRPEMKPDVIEQTLKLEKERAKMAEETAASSGGNIILQEPGKEPVALNNQQVVQIIQQLQKEVADKDKEIVQLKNDVRELMLELANREHNIQKQTGSLTASCHVPSSVPAPVPAPAIVSDTSSISNDVQNLEPHDTIYV